MIIVGGHTVRNECVDSITLGSEIGVQRWIEASNPLVHLKVTDLSTSEDVTDKFKEFAKFTKSRFAGGVDYVNLYREVGT